MTVRAWFTISALVLAALAAAFALQLFRPVRPPEILVRAGEQRLDGGLVTSCWPQRNGELRCDQPDEPAVAQTVPDNGSFRVVLASPAQPKDGWVRIEDAAGRDVLEVDEWKRTVRYELDPGAYTMLVQAGQSGPNKAYVRYRFAVRVTRSGS